MRVQLAFASFLLICEAIGAVSREAAAEYMKTFDDCRTVVSETNQSTIVRRREYCGCKIQLFQTLGNSLRKRIRIDRADGGIEMYDYVNEMPERAFSSDNTNTSSGVMTVFVNPSSSGDGVDCIEFDIEKGKMVGASRVLGHERCLVSFPTPVGL